MDVRGRRGTHGSALHDGRGSRSMAGFGSPIRSPDAGAASEQTRSPRIVVRIKLLSSSEPEQFSPDERKMPRSEASGIALTEHLPFDATISSDGPCDRGTLCARFAVLRGGFPTVAWTIRTAYRPPVAERLNRAALRHPRVPDRAQCPKRYPRTGFRTGHSARTVAENRVPDWTECLER
jgi:hypothetical protein